MLDSSILIYTIYCVLSFIEIYTLSFCFIPKFSPFPQQGLLCVNFWDFAIVP